MIRTALPPARVGQPSFLPLRGVPRTGAASQSRDIAGWMWSAGTLDAAGRVQDERSMEISMWNSGRLWPAGIVVEEEVM